MTREQIASYWENYAKACRATGPEPRMARIADRTAALLREPDGAALVREAYERGARDLADWLDDQELTDYAMDQQAERFLATRQRGG